MEIYNCLGGPCEVNCMQNRWNNLRDMYLKAKKEERAYIRSESAAPKKKISKHNFQLFEMMTFLDNLSESMRTITSLTSDSESEVENDEDDEDKHFYEILCKSIVSPIHTLSETDPIECLLLSLGPTLRELNEHRRSRVENQFQQIS